MKKSIILISTMIVSVMACVCICGCSQKSNTPDAVQILTDYNNNYQDTLFANFTNATINTETVNGDTYSANVVFTGSDTYAEYQLDTDIHYIYNNGWTFDARRFTSKENVRYTCKRGRTETELKNDILQNGTTYIPDGKNITYVTNLFSESDQKDYVLVTWQKQKGALMSEYEGELQFSYKSGGEWKCDSVSVSSEAHTIQNVENTSWRYRKNNIMIDKYPDFIINTISEDCKQINATFGTMTYDGYADAKENITDGKITYKISGNREIKSIVLNYAVNEFFEDYDDFVQLEFSGGYTKFHRVK